jgi:DNA-directed RNA polymerase alpha subunit
VNEFKRGDKVRITIDATVTDVRDDRHWSVLEFAYDSELLDPYEGSIYTASPAAAVEPLPADPPPMERKPAPDRDADIDTLGLSARVRNCLVRYGLWTVGILLACTEAELMEMRNFGPDALAEVRDVLAAHGLELRS